MDESDNIYNVYCGKLDYVLANDQEKNVAQFADTLGWRSAKKPGKVPYSVEPFHFDQSASEEDNYDQFGQAIVAAAKQSGKKEIFLCVHGFNNSFAVAAGKAARLAYNVQCPVVLYSWPSTARLLQYIVDSGNNEWSQEHFNRLMEELIDLKEKNGLRINLVAHSMGNRLAVRSIPVIAHKPLFEQVFLVDPDFDAETFFHYIVRYKPSKGQSAVATKVRILFSRKDRALPLAQLLFGGYTRLGQGADTLLESLFNPLQLPNAIQDTAGMLSKLNPFGDDSKIPAKPVASDIMYKKFEWIDFTAIDHGPIGHTIPYEMIANLWSTGKPGQGLKLVDSQAGQVNGLTQFAAKCFKQKKHIGELGKCEQVVVEKIPSANRQMGR